MRKIMKRMTALILVVIMVFGTILTGCGKKETATENTNITQGEWLTRLNESFGMSTYENETPYYSNIDSNNTYFPTYQIAKEWGILDDNVEINPSKEITKEVAANSLVNIANLTGDSTEIKNKDKLYDANKTGIAISNGIFSLDDKKKFDYDSLISKEDADKVISIAKDKWLHPNYEMNESYDIKSGVVDLSEKKSSITDYRINDDNSVFIATSDNSIVEDGYTYVIPANSNNLYAKAYKAKSVEVVDGGILIHNTDENLEFEDVVKEMHVQNSFKPDFANCIITTPDGSVIDNNESTTQTYTDRTYSSNSLAYNSGSSNGKTKQTYEIAKQTAKFDIAVGSDGKITVEIGPQKIATTYSGKVKIKGREVELSKTLEMSDFSVDGKVDYSFFGGLKLIRSQASYQINEKYAASTNLFDITNIDKFDSSHNISDDAEAQQILNDTFSKFIEKAGEKYQSSSIKICDIATPLTIGGVAGVNFELRLGISASGKIEISMSSKVTEGIEYAKGKGIRNISEKSVDSDITVEAEAEAYLYFGIVLGAFGFNIADLGAEVGVGASASATLHMIDASVVGVEGVYLMAQCNAGNVSAEYLQALQYQTGSYASSVKLQSCVDVDVYFIFRITAGKNSLLGKFVTGEWNICGKDTGPHLYQAHFEDGKYVGKDCTIKFRAERKAEEIESSITDEGISKYKDENSVADVSQNGNVTDADSLNIKDVLDIDAYFTSLTKGASKTINVTSTPNGYNKEQFIWYSDDPSVATVDGSGNITAVGVGSTYIHVKTLDEKYNVQCSVAVIEGTSITFTPL